MLRPKINLNFSRRSYFFHCVLTAVMKGTKPFVPRHIYRTIIAVKVSVMKLMVETANRETFFILHQKRVEPGMSEHRSERKRTKMKNNMHWMRRHNQMDQNWWKVKKMFNGMHGNSRKRACGDISVVKRMHATIKKFNMEQPMHTVKMKSNPDKYHRQG